jgi:hypothetical protein
VRLRASGANVILRTLHETFVHVTGVGSDAVYLVITAAAGILGAILGAGATGLASFKLERRRELTRARAGARLLRADFEKAAAMFGVIQVKKQLLLHVDFKIDGWGDFRDVIAGELDAAEWNEVDGAVRMVRTVQEAQEAIRRQYEAGEMPMPPTRTIDHDEAHSMEARREQMAKAYNVLTALAGGPQADETFGVP